MKPIATLSIALFLCMALFFILRPLAGSQTFEENEKKELPIEKESIVTGKYIDKIAEFPILPEQSKRLQILQQQRQKSIQGMEPTHIKIPSIEVDAIIQPTGILENGEMEISFALHPYQATQPLVVCLFSLIYLVKCYELLLKARMKTSLYLLYMTHYSSIF